MEQNPAYPDALKDAEAILLGMRRQALGRRTPVSDEHPLVGFAVSGGGIRSATFCLGVFQSLAAKRLLGKIDYLSSVSGGGYFASFLGRLFSRDEIKNVTEVEDIITFKTSTGPRATSPDTWKDGVFRWLRENGRYLAPRGAGDLLFDIAVALRNWIAVLLVICTSMFGIFLFLQLLRAPAEGIDLIRQMTTAISGKWLWWSPYALLAGLFFFVGVLPSGVAYWFLEPKTWVWVLAGTLLVIVGVIAFATPPTPRRLAIEVAVVLSAVLTVIYWLAGLLVAQVALRRERDEDPPQEGSHEDDWIMAGYPTRRARNIMSNWLKLWLVWMGAISALALVDSIGQTLYAVGFLENAHPGRAIFAVIYGALVFIAPAAKWIFASFGQKAGSKRPALSLQLIGTIGALVVFLPLLIRLDMLAHGVARDWCFPSHVPPVIVETFSKSASAHSDGSCTFNCGEQSFEVTPGRTSQGSPPQVPPSSDIHTPRLVEAFIVVLLITLALARTRPFLNRSSLATLYGARLKRAYLGASNKNRYPTSRLREEKLGDDIDQEVYWPAVGIAPGSPIPDPLSEDQKTTPYAKGAPLHIVNVTFNETINPQSQVEQADRKGLELAVGPAGLSASVYHHVIFDISAPPPKSKKQPPRGLMYEKVTVKPDDGFRIFDYPDNSGKRPYVGEQLSLGDWTAVSGAAFATGLGFRTSLSLSLLAGFFNIRLGYWWDSGVNPRSRRELDGTAKPGSLAMLLHNIFMVQDFLADEFLARFHGTARRQWYLTDGGHFENMGAYELIRRRVKMMVVIDAEADSDYTFEGIANLVRKARLDFGAEITFLSEDKLNTTVDPQVRRHFGTLEQLRRGTWSSQPVTDPARDVAPAKASRRMKRLSVAESSQALSLAHAALARVTYIDTPTAPPSTLLLIKPTLIGDESADVHRYHSDHPEFPHETTADQFFDEAQWESYRKLGEHIGNKIFAQITPSERHFAPCQFIGLEKT